MENKKYDAVLKKAYKKIIETVELLPENGWNKNNSDEQQGITNHIRSDEETGMTVCRGEGILDYPAEYLYKFLSNPMNKPKYSKRVSCMEMLQKSHEGNFITYNTVRSPFGSDRDAVTINGAFIEKGNYYIVSTSIQGDSLKDKQKGHIRASIHYQSHILMPRPDGKTRFILMNCMDINGMIPKFIKNQMSKNIGLQGVKNIVECMQKQQQPNQQQQQILVE